MTVQFLAMLEVIKTGEADIVLYWRDDRLVRHPRVAVAVEDALDIGDMARNGKGRIELKDATGAVLDRFTLAIKAAIWREENKRRAELTKMGKIATLQQGRWPGDYRRFGYKSRKEEGKRGRIIEVDEQEAATVMVIHEMFDAGFTVRNIQEHLIKNNMEQKGYACKHDWDRTVIYNVLQSEYYIGTATWRFSDGANISITIPSIVPRELWERNQARIERNKNLSRRNTKGIYLLQGMIFCGDCGGAMGTAGLRWYYRNGKRLPHNYQQHQYQCPKSSFYSNEEHPSPYTRSGVGLDWQVWRHLVDNAIKRPGVINAYILSRQAELQDQGESVDGDIAHVRQRLAEVEEERAFYQRQAARRKITEREFDIRMEETKERYQYWQSELDRLKELRDNQDKVRAGTEYVNELMERIQTILLEVDLPPDELKKLTREKQIEILKMRQDIIRALVSKVTVWASGQVKIEGILDGSEAAQFELGGP